MEEKYSEGGSLPLYFEDLRSNLSNSTSQEEWFRLYLEFHPALMASLARRNFLAELSHNIQGMKDMHSAKSKHSAKGKQPAKGMQPAWADIFDVSVPVGSTSFKDWTDELLQGNETMKKVYSEKKENGEPADYDDTYRSQLLYARQLLKHLNRQCERDGKTTLKHVDEIELYTSCKIPKLLPYLLKNLLKSCRNQILFNGVFESYKAEQKSTSDVPRKLFCL